MNSASSLSATYILPVFMMAAWMSPHSDIELMLKATCKPKSVSLICPVLAQGSSRNVSLSKIVKCHSCVPYFT
jgi:hypothetical protein